MTAADLAAVRRARKAWAPEANLETAAVLRLLMVRPWLVSGRDDEAIAAVRRNLDAVRDAFARLGWVVVVERDLVRLRKTPPGRRDAFATSGPAPLTCQWLFLLVAAAETVGRRVGLGTLVTAARTAAAESGVPTTGDIIERRATVAALKMLDNRGVVEQLDGDVDGYVQDENAPVLLAVHHTRLLHVIANFADMDPHTDPTAWLEAVEREPDAARRMRRRLVDDAVVHATDLDEAEADWMRRRVRGDDGQPLAGAFGLHVERRSEGAAFVVPEGAFRHPRELGPLPFPTSGTVAHAAYLLCAWVNGSQSPAVTVAGWPTVDASAVVGKLAELASDQAAGSGGWRRELAEDPGGLLHSEVLGLLAGLDLVRTDETGRCAFSPATARWRAPITTGQPRRRGSRTHREEALGLGADNDPGVA